MKIHDKVAECFSTIFEEKLLDEICNYGILKTTETDQIILEIRRDIKFIPLIVSGIVKVMRRDGKGNGIFLHYINKKETSAIAVTYSLENKKSEIRLKAQGNVTYIAVPVKVVNSWFVNYSSWRAFYFKFNQEQTAYLIETINDIAFTDLENRLIKYLNCTSTICKSNTIFKKHFDIARDLKVSREAISRTLKKLEKEYLITLGRNKIILK